MRLSIKQKAFADYYIMLGNATEAARRAGYSEKTANRIATENLSKPVIRSYIGDRLKQIEDKRIADATEVLKYLTSVLRGESEAEIVVVEGVGDGCSAARHIKKTPDEKEKLKAAELLAKRYGLLTEKLEISSEVVILDDIDAD